MRVVIDSNQLQSDALRRYLAKSNANFAVLTDYAAMEAYKGDTLASIYKSMAILAEYPAQVIVLKGTRVVCGLSGRRAGVQRRLIDAGQTKGFAVYARNLHQARNGNRAIQQQLLALGQEATAHMNRMLVDAQTTGAVIEDIANLYSKEERAAVRMGQAYTSEMVDMTVKTIMHIAGTAFRDHPNVHIPPTYDELPNTFIFRVALCTYLLALEWSARGGAKDASPVKFRNDFVDMNFAAYATFFDGLMTADAKVVRIHNEARIWLTAMFDCHLSGGLARRGRYL